MWKSEHFNVVVRIQFYFRLGYCLNYVYHVDVTLYGDTGWSLLIVLRGGGGGWLIASHVDGEGRAPVTGIAEYLRWVKNKIQR